MSTPIASTALAWLGRPADAALTPNDVHVIAAALDDPDAAAIDLLGTLDREERGRADRFHFPRDRDRFRIGRGMLRGLLAHYTGVPPDRIRLKNGARGKPALDDANAALHFNVSHAGGVALFAFTRLTELGIDVEHIHEMPDLLPIAERFFAPAERRALRKLDGQEQLEAFFVCWTRKEAYIKAIGEGLACPLDRFVVTMHPDERARFVEIGGDGIAAAMWTLEDLRPAPGYVGAVAIPSVAPTIRCWRW
ncbi:MAG: 4'-phosphopantetheinyl transferase family protein [Gemmatimonadaceae bacterium]